LNQAGLASDLRIASSFAISAHVNRFGPAAFRHRVARSTAKIVKVVEDRQGRRRSSRPSKIVKIVKIVTGFAGRNALTALNIFRRKQLLQHIQHKLRSRLELLPLPAREIGTFLIQNANNQ